MLHLFTVAFLTLQYCRQMHSNKFRHLHRQSNHFKRNKSGGNMCTIFGVLSLTKKGSCSQSLTNLVVHITAQQRGINSGVPPWVRLHAVSTLSGQAGCQHNVLGAICRRHKCDRCLSRANLLRICLFFRFFFLLIASTSSWFPTARALSNDSLIRFPTQSDFKPPPMQKRKLVNLKLSLSESNSM